MFFGAPAAGGLSGAGSACSLARAGLDDCDFSLALVSSILVLALEARRFLEGRFDGLEGGIGTKLQ